LVSTDTFYATIESLITSAPPHDEVVVFGDLNAVSGTDRTGFDEIAHHSRSTYSMWKNSSLLLKMCLNR